MSRCSSAVLALIVPRGELRGLAIFCASRCCSSTCESLSGSFGCGAEFIIFGTMAMFWRLFDGVGVWVLIWRVNFHGAVLLELGLYTYSDDFTKGVSGTIFEDILVGLLFRCFLVCGFLSLSFFFSLLDLLDDGVVRFLGF